MSSVGLHGDEGVHALFGVLRLVHPRFGGESAVDTRLLGVDKMLTLNVAFSYGTAPTSSGQFSTA